MRTPSSIVGNMTSCRLPPRVGAVQPPWCLSILIPSPSSLIGSRPLTNFPLFFSFFLFYYFFFLGCPWSSRLIVWMGFSVGLGWVGSAFFLFLAKFLQVRFFFLFQNCYFFFLILFSRVPNFYLKKNIARFLFWVLACSQKCERILFLFFYTSISPFIAEFG
jgi:hypothetical protein